MVLLLDLGRLAAAVSLLGCLPVSLATAYDGVAQQAGFNAPARTASHAYNNASDLLPLHLSSLGSGEFTTLSHPRFPSHRVRVKKTNFCDPTVK